MKKRFILLFLIIFLFLHSIYSQNPQLKMWSIPDYIYEFPTSTYIPPNSFTQSLAGSALYYHNIMYMNNNMTTTGYHPKNNLWFYTLDNNIYYYNYKTTNSTLICSLNSSYYAPPNKGLVHGEICIVPAPDHTNNPNQYYVITPGEFAKLNLCSSTNNTFNYEIGNLETIKPGELVDDPHYLPWDGPGPNPCCPVRHYFLSASKEYIIYGIPTRYLFRYTSPWGKTSLSPHEAYLDIFRITGSGIDWIQTLDQNTYFPNVPFEFGYISEMELVSKITGNVDGYDEITFRLALPYVNSGLMPGIKVLEFTQMANNPNTYLPMTANKDYIFRSSDNSSTFDLYGQKINGLEFSPNGKHLFFNTSAQSCASGAPLAVNKLFYINLNDYGNLPIPNINTPNPINLIKMPVPPTTNYNTDYANSFIEWGYDDKLYYANGSSLLSVNILNKTNYTPTSADVWRVIDFLDPNNVPFTFNKSWDISLCFESCSGVYTLPDQIDGEVYDNTLGCCMSVPTLPVINNCISEGIDVTQAFTDWSFDYIKIDYNDGTVATFHNQGLPLSPLNHLYSHAGSFLLTITLYWPCGTQEVSTSVYVRPSGQIPTLNFPLNTICTGCDPNNQCQAKWEGPSIMLLNTDFNADQYELKIWNYGDIYDYAHLYDSRMGMIQLPTPPSVVLPTSYTTGDIGELFSLPDNSCRRFHYELILSNCNNGVSYIGDIYVNGCNCANNICTQHCCTKSFHFDQANICVGAVYTPSIIWDNPNELTFPFTSSVSFGDFSGVLNLIPSTTFTCPTHQYSLPGSYTVSIILDWGNGCPPQTFSQTVNVSVSGPIPDLEFPQYTRCFLDPGIPTYPPPYNPCQPIWDGPTMMLAGTDFNSDHYELDLWEYNSSNNYSGTSQYSKEDYKPYSSFTPGDIYYSLLNTTNSCHRYHFRLVLSNCGISRLFVGDFIVNTCQYDAINNSCIEYCCSRNFHFYNKTICLGESYTPDDFIWADNSPISIFDEIIDYGDGYVYMAEKVTDYVTPPAHYYATPGIKTVTITIDFRNGSNCLNGQKIVQQHITVNGGEPNPELFIPDYTICSAPLNGCDNINNRCIPFWEGPKINPSANEPWNNDANSYNNFNATHYELTIYHYNSNHQPTGGNTYTGTKLTIEESFTEGDINHQFNPDITCVEYQYSITLQSCTYGQTPYINSEKTYSNYIKVSPCDCNMGYCNPDPSSCDDYYQENWGALLLPDSINIINDISNENNNIKIYPNPAKDKLFINVSSNNNPLEYGIELQNILSETLMNINSINTNLYTIDLSRYCKGIYLIKITTNNKAIIFKVIKD